MMSTIRRMRKCSLMTLFLVSQLQLVHSDSEDFYDAASRHSGLIHELYEYQVQLYHQSIAQLLKLYGTHLTQSKASNHQQPIAESCFQTAKSDIREIAGCFEHIHDHPTIDGKSEPKRWPAASKWIGAFRVPEFGGSIEEQFHDRQVVQKGSNLPIISPQQADSFSSANWVAPDWLVALNQPITTTQRPLIRKSPLSSRLAQLSLVYTQSMNKRQNYLQTERSKLNSKRLSGLKRSFAEKKSQEKLIARNKFKSDNFRLRRINRRQKRQIFPIPNAVNTWPDYSKLLHTAEKLLQPILNVPVTNKRLLPIADWSAPLITTNHYRLRNPFQVDVTPVSNLLSDMFNLDVPGHSAKSPLPVSAPNKYYHPLFRNDLVFLDSNSRSPAFVDPSLGTDILKSIAKSEDWQKLMKNLLKSGTDLLKYDFSGNTIPQSDPLIGQSPLVERSLQRAPIFSDNRRQSSRNFRSVAPVHSELSLTISDLSAILGGLASPIDVLCTPLSLLTTETAAKEHLLRRRIDLGNDVSQLWQEVFSKTSKNRLDLIRQAFRPRDDSNSDWRHLLRGHQELINDWTELRASLSRQQRQELIDFGYTTMLSAQTQPIRRNSMASDPDSTNVSLSSVIQKINQINPNQSISTDWNSGLTPFMFEPLPKGLVVIERFLLQAAENRLIELQTGSDSSGPSLLSDFSSVDTISAMFMQNEGSRALSDLLVNPFAVMSKIIELDF